MTVYLAIHADSGMPIAAKQSIEDLLAEFEQEWITLLQDTDVERVFISSQSAYCGHVRLEEREPLEEGKEVERMTIDIYELTL